MKFNVLAGKGARGRYNAIATIGGPIAEPVARMHAASVRKTGFRTKVEPVT